MKTRRYCPTMFRQFLTEKQWKAISPKDKKMMRELNSLQRRLGKYYKGHENCFQEEQYYDESDY